MSAQMKKMIAIIGAGPVGLAAAANAVERGLDFIILEAGESVAASMRSWGHVRLFTPWSYLVASPGQVLLEQAGTWMNPDPKHVPLAGEMVQNYLDPLAQLPQLASRLHLRHKVVAITKEGHDRMKDGDRARADFIILADTPEGRRRFRATSVVDASGTWTSPNPLGAAGVAAQGEAENRECITYGMPDIAGRDRDRYAGKRVLVVGSGHSAIGNVLDLVALKREQPDTLIAWGLRRDNPAKVWGGGAKDELESRGRLGSRVHDAVHQGEVTLLTGLSIGAITRSDSGLRVVDVEGNTHLEVDEIIVSTGARPDKEMTRELRLEFDTVTEAVKTIGPLIDPNHHSCGSVSPHGALELMHPEKNFYTVGMKSYGRAPTFLLMTGYEQVRSVIAELAGDTKAAREVHLELPQTGVCSTELGSGTKKGGCC